MAYHRMTPEERYQIAAEVGSQKSIRSIAKKFKRSPSTISRELKKCPGAYSAKKAQAQTDLRIASRGPALRKIQGDVERYVVDCLSLDWSPEQIAGRLVASKSTVSISHQTIYRFVAREKAVGGSLWKHLRILRKQRKDRNGKYWKSPSERLTERRWITERPIDVEKRQRLGDFERDTVFGKFNGGLLLTIVDRTSRFLKIAYIPKKSSYMVHQATVEALEGKVVHTITNDNGPEFAKHEMTEGETGGKVYFSNCYRSWERGTNENTNGLLRQYFPKSKEINASDWSKIERAELLINSRPRKCLGFKTPLEVEREKRSQVLR